MATMKTDEKLVDDAELQGVVTRNRGSVGSIYDDVFGEITDKGVNYRSMGWLGTAVLMVKTQIGLGVLSIPETFDVLGIVPGVICLIVVAIITTWSDYIVGVFKLRHRSVYSLDDAGRLMFGKIGREIFAVAFVLYWIFVAGSGMLGISIGLNAVSDHAVCTAVFVAVAFVIGATFASIQTLSKISWLAWVGATCILMAVFTVAIGVGVEDRPSAAPQTGVWVSDYKIVGHPSFTEAVTAVSSLIFAYAGTPAFFSIVAEMKDPSLYPRSLAVCQTIVTVTYITVGCVIYYYCGSYVASPALGSAGPTIKKIGYGFALPGLMVTTILVTHIPAKYVFVRALRGTHHLAGNTFVHWAAWLGCTFGTALIAYVIASAIPVFGGLVSLVGALLGTLMSFQPMGCMWLYDNWGVSKGQRTLRWKLMVLWAVFVIVSGTFMMIAGTYGAVVGIVDSYKVSGGSAAWSCADNSNSAGSGGH